MGVPLALDDGMGKTEFAKRLRQHENTDCDHSWADRVENSKVETRTSKTPAPRSQRGAWGSWVNHLRRTSKKIDTQKVIGAGIKKKGGLDGGEMEDQVCPHFISPSLIGADLMGTIHLAD